MVEGVGARTPLFAKVAVVAVPTIDGKCKFLHEFVDLSSMSEVCWTA